MERAAGTFQDRLVTELRLADALTMDQATAVLQDFLPRYNARFAVQPEHPEPAYRSADPDLTLSEILCFKDTRKVGRDNTVKYQRRTLQLLTRTERPSYAGARVEVLERSDGRLQVRHDGEIVPCRPAPPRPGALRAAYGALESGAARQGPRALPERNRPPIGHLTQYGPQVRSLPDPADQSSTNHGVRPPAELAANRSD